MSLPNASNFMPDYLGGCTVTIQLLAVLKTANYYSWTKPTFRSIDTTHLLATILSASWWEPYTLAVVNKGSSTVYCISRVIIYSVIGSQWWLCQCCWDVIKAETSTWIYEFMFIKNLIPLYSDTLYHQILFHSTQTNNTTRILWLNDMDDAKHIECKLVDHMIQQISVLQYCFFKKNTDTIMYVITM